MTTKQKWALGAYAVPLGVLSAALAVAVLVEVGDDGWRAATVAWTGILAIFMVVMVGLKWFPRSADDPGYARGEIVFCEGYERGQIKQPICVWTDLAFVAAGLGVILAAGTSTGALNPMDDATSVIPLLYGLIVIFMGPASMAFHASMKMWGGWFDNMSIIVWAAFSLSYTLDRLADAGGFGAGHWPLWVVTTVIVVVVGAITWSNDEIRRYTQMATAGAWVLLELIVMILIWAGSAPGFERSTGWFVASLVAFALAFACWMPSGGVWRAWCNPRSPLQGHGFWHIFAAVGTLMVYFYFASEVPTP